MLKVFPPLFSSRVWLKKTLWVLRDLSLAIKLKS